MTLPSPDPLAPQPKPAGPVLTFFLNGLFAGGLLIMGGAFFSFIGLMGAYIGSRLGGRTGGIIGVIVAILLSIGIITIGYLADRSNAQKERYAFQPEQGSPGDPPHALLYPTEPSGILSDRDHEQPD